MLDKIIEDFKEFTLLEKIVCAIDLLINPRAIDYPIVVGEIPDKYTRPFSYLIFKRKTGLVFVVKKTDKKIIYLRWL